MSTALRDTEMGARLARVLGFVFAALILAVGLVPWAVLLPGGRDDAFAWPTLEAWASGTAVAAGVGVVLAMLDRRLGFTAGRPWAVVARAAEMRPVLWAWVLAGMACTLYAVIGATVFNRQPLLIDEIVQALQGRIFTEGRLWRPAFADPAVFSIPLVADRDGRVFGQFPPGWPAVLAVFDLLRARWLAAPVVAALGVVATAWWLRAVEPRPVVRWVALVLAAAAPFMAFQAGTQMNHAPVVAALMLGLAGTAHALSRDNAPHWGAAVASGLGFGLAATSRPVDALCFGVPAGVWWVWRAVRVPALRGPLVVAGIAGLVPVSAMLVFNAATTGSALTFGYVYHWGPSHTLGFHESPHRYPHTPVLGLELVSLYLFRLNRVVFEWPIPALLPVAGALLLGRRATAADATARAGALLLLGAYFAYFHDGWYLGPRFMLPLVPLLALETARLPAEIAARWPGLAASAVRWTLVAAAVIGAGSLLPREAANYAIGLSTMRMDGTVLAEQAGVRGALVLVRESWGAQLMARLWAQGLLPGDAEWVYKRVDQCALQAAADSLDHAGVRGPAALAAYTAMTRDSLRVRPLEALVDRSGRFDPARGLTPSCVQRVEQERAGYTLLAPRLLDRGDNVYARELPGRDTLVLAAYPERPVFRLRAVSAEPGAALVFEPVSRDSVWAAARGVPPQ
jgi:hypothetical protein